MAAFGERLTRLEAAEHRRLGAAGVIGPVASDESVRAMAAEVKGLADRVVAIEKALGAGRAVRVALLALPGVIGGVAGVWALLS